MKEQTQKDMTQAQINSEIANTKILMDRLMDCIKDGKMEYYKEYIQLSNYYLKLNQVKPNHKLKTV